MITSEEKYDVGDLLKIYFYFYNEDGVTPVDPDTVTLKVKTPTGQITTYVYNVDAQVVREAGTDPANNNAAYIRYYLLVKFTRSGWWWFRGEALGAGESSEEFGIEVAPSQF